MHSELEHTDIIEYLQAHEDKDLLKFITCGSVDDGKSTLIGRLMYDSKMIFEDQMAAIKNDSKKFGTTGEELDLALLVDGLQSEREQGITIDVAYRFFNTENRKFIVADCPGHEQYTRNMATGASTCQLAVILIDARNGVSTQTIRHSYIMSLLGVKNVVVAVNKMDLMDYSEETFKKICGDYQKISEELNLANVEMIPMSALKGDNVVTKSESMAWYKGLPLLPYLESVKLEVSDSQEDFRLPVQYVNRPNLDFRGYCGTVGSGQISLGDEVVSMPNGAASKVKQLLYSGADVETVGEGMAVTMVLEDEIDTSSGDVIVANANSAKVIQHAEVDTVWMTDNELEPGRDYLFKIGSKYVRGTFSSVEYRVDINTLEKQPADELKVNEIGRCILDLDTPVVLDLYGESRATGSVVVIDRLTNVTIGACMVVDNQVDSSKVTSLNNGASKYSDSELELNAFIRKHYPHWEARDISKD